MKKLPIGISSLERILANNMLYVDKTEHIYNLIKSERRRYFLARPRRFGKSLICSTLQAIFKGRKELFNNLWLGKSNYEFKSYPIIFFDFNEISHQTPDILEKGLHGAIDSHAHKYSINLFESELSARFAELIIALGTTFGPVVIFIDEYDKAILTLIDDLDAAERSRNIFRNFYATLNTEDVDANIHFLFITGVSKCTQVGLLAELNNLDDLTNDERAAALVGYTNQEVDHYFKEHIETFSDKREESYNQTRAELKAWYDGYRFSSVNITVYNPTSLHNCLTKQFLTNYWFASGTTNFLINFIRRNPHIASDVETVDGSFYASSNLKKFTPKLYYDNYRTLFLQTGYLTFASDYDANKGGYCVGYPNKETYYAMTEQVMEVALGGVTSNQTEKRY